MVYAENMPAMSAIIGREQQKGEKLQTWANLNSKTNPTELFGHS